MKIGLFGGTFDPFHLGHMKALKTFCNALGGSKVVVMPTGIHPDKNEEREMSDEDRLEMVKHAVSGLSNVCVSDYEIKKKGKCYTSETLSWLQSQVSPADSVYLYTGSDMFLSLHKWHDPDTLFCIANIICVSRTGMDYDELYAQKARLEKEFLARCRIIHTDPVDVSAAAVRGMLRRGDEDARLYLPESVYAFLAQKGAYGREPSLRTPPSTLKEYKSILSRRLDPSRYDHSLGVMKTMEKLARIYGADVKKAKLCGLLHDITKNDTAEEQLALINKYRIPLDDAQLRNPKLHHSITAPYVLRYELGINDEEILSAVRYHTTARPDMTLMEKLLYVADYVDPTRDYEDVEFYRQLALEDVDYAAFLCLAYTMEDLSSQKAYIYKDTYDAYQHYVRYYELHPDKVYDVSRIDPKKGK